MRKHKESASDGKTAMKVAFHGEQDKLLNTYIK